MRGLIVLFSVVVQLIVLIKVAAGWGWNAGLLCMLGIFANGITCAAVYGPNENENDNEQE